MYMMAAFINCQMPEREVVVCSADEGQQARKQLSRAPHLFSLGITWFFLHEHLYTYMSSVGCVLWFVTRCTRNLDVTKVLQKVCVPF